MNFAPDYRNTVAAARNQRPARLTMYEYLVNDGVCRRVRADRRYKATARGFALGSGNSVPDYVPQDGYEAMVRAAQEIRAREPK